MANDRINTYVISPTEDIGIDDNAPSPRNLEIEEDIHNRAPLNGSK